MALVIVPAGGPDSAYHGTKQWPVISGAAAGERAPIMSVILCANIHRFVHGTDRPDRLFGFMYR
jgi:hypothetical protein